MKIKPKFVYFDVGGVLILDFSKTDKWERLKREWGITTEIDEEFEKIWDPFEGEVGRGFRDVQELIPILNDKFGLKLPNNYSVLIDGFVNRFEFNRAIWPVVEKICQQCRVGVLTVMYPKMLAAIKKRGLMRDVPWDAVVDSSLVQANKSDRKIYEIAEKLSGCKNKEILFVENSPRHIRTASKFGWQTFLYDSGAPEESSQKLLAAVT